MPNQSFKEVKELQNNVSFLTKTVLNKSNKHAHFLSEIARFSVKVEHIVESSGVNNLQENKELTKVMGARDGLFR